MQFLLDLWLPIVLSAVVVFFASFAAWTLLPHHREDIRPLPDEGPIVSALATLRLPPGMYAWPMPAKPADYKTKEFADRSARGPWGSLNVQPAAPSMGRSLVLVFLFYLVVGVFVAYVTSQSVVPGAEYLRVFQIAGTVAIVAYCFGQIPGAIFFGKSLRFTLTDLLDGVVYGLLTAGIFSWLWPR